jgi:ankyrin repeat protein
MLANGHDPNAIDESLSTPLIACLQKSGSKSYSENQLEIVKLLTPVTEVLWSDREGLTALMHAARRRHTAVVEILLKCSDASARDKKRMAALDHLFDAPEGEGDLSGQINKLLSPVTIDWRYSMHHLNKDIHGRNFLKAAKQGDVTKLRKMLISEEKRRAEPDFDIDSSDLTSAPLVEKIDSSESTALMIAAGCGHTECVEVLLAYGSQTLRRNKYGRSALMLGVKGKSDSHRDCTRLLLVNSYANAKDNGGESALFYAVRHPGTGIFELIFEIARHDFANDLGQTPLMLAVEAGHAEAVKLLLPTSNAKACDTKGRSALDYASGNYPEILKMFVDADS